MAENVGDIESSKVGSAARYNAGKDRLDLYPVAVLTKLWMHGKQMTEENRVIFAILNCMQLWESRQGSPTDPLYAALSLIDKDGTLASQVLEYGQRKYAAWNWTKGMKWSVCKASVLRHIRAIVLKGEVDDAESGLPHFGHIACNLMFLIYYADHFPQGDDRSPVWEKEGA